MIPQALSQGYGLRPGDRVRWLGRDDRTELTIVGVAIDVDQASVTEGWTAPQDIARLAAGRDVTYEMLYCLRQNPDTAELRTKVNELQRAVPSIAGISTYLTARESAQQTSAGAVVMLSAFSVFALGAVALIVGNLVAGIVLANRREIGVVRALGFTPTQVVVAVGAQMVLPALAGCAAGAAVAGIAAQPLVNAGLQAMDLPAQLVPPQWGLMGVACALLIVSAAAALAAMRAGRLRPAEALAPAPQALRGHGQVQLGSALHRFGAPAWLSIGVDGAFARPLRGALTAVAVVVGVATLVFAMSFHGTMDHFNADGGLNGSGNYDVRVTRYGTYPDAAAMATIQAFGGAESVVAETFSTVHVAGLPDTAPPSPPVERLPSSAIASFGVAGSPGRARR